MKQPSRHYPADLAGPLFAVLVAWAALISFTVLVIHVDGDGNVTSSTGSDWIVILALLAITYAACWWFASALLSILGRRNHSGAQQSASSD